jgi:hypothetical protein
MASKKMTTARRLAALYEGSYRARTNLESEAIMIAGDRWDGVRAVAFDAVGTLITPMPPAAEVYAAVGRRFGSRLDVAAIAECFHRAFRDEENRDRLSGWRTDAAREVERWRSIVANVLPDVVEPEKCFRSLCGIISLDQSLGNWLLERQTSLRSCGAWACALELRPISTADSIAYSWVFRRSAAKRTSSSALKLGGGNPPRSFLLPW